jgi:hypothetical protein
MKLKPIAYHFVFFLLLMAVQQAAAQPGGALRGMGNRMRGMGGGGRGGGGGDSLERRNRFEDSLTINYRYLDSTRSYTFDSSISDYTNWFPVPPTHVYLGNVGTASHSLLFQPRMRSGWNPGFHAFDVYKLRLENWGMCLAVKPSRSFKSCIRRI